MTLLIIITLFYIIVALTVAISCIKDGARIEMSLIVGFIWPVLLVTVTIYEIIYSCYDVYTYLFK